MSKYYVLLDLLALICVVLTSPESHKMVQNTSINGEESA